MSHNINYFILLHLPATLAPDVISNLISCPNLFFHCLFFFFFNKINTQTDSREVIQTTHLRWTRTYNLCVQVHACVPTWGLCKCTWNFVVYYMKISWRLPIIGGHRDQLGCNMAARVAGRSRSREFTRKTFQPQELNKLRELKTVRHSFWVAKMWIIVCHTRHENWRYFALGLGSHWSSFHTPIILIASFFILRTSAATCSSATWNLLFRTATFFVTSPHWQLLGVKIMAPLPTTSLSNATLMEKQSTLVWRICFKWMITWLKF